jgi:magnesium transporter
MAHPTKARAPEGAGRRSKRRRRAPGTSPGTLAVEPHWPQPEIRVLAYGPESCEEVEVQDPAAIPELLQKWPMAWIDVVGLGDAETLQKLGEIFKIHRLALEDVLNPDHRAKAEEFDDHLFVIARMVAPETSDPCDTKQVSLFCGEKFVLTFRDRPGDCFDAIRARIRAERGRIRAAGADYLTYALVDATIDSYFPAVEQLEENVEDLEEGVLERSDRDTVARIQQVKADLIRLRRFMWPHREMVQVLLREDTGFISEPTRIYLRDCSDHVLQITELIDGYREMCTDLIHVCLSSVSNRANEIMKVLTVIATIFIPLSFIAGVYGMNFKTDVSPWNIPELDWYFGYPFALAVMAVVAVGFVLYLRSKKWL